MSQVIDQTAFDRGTRSLFRLLTAEQLRQLQSLPPDAELQPRVEELASRCREGDLTLEERAEYEGYVRANNLLAVLQGMARRHAPTSESRP